MRRLDQHALTDAAPGRVTMPFLPTLAVVAVLGVASVYCPSPRPSATAPQAAAAQASAAQASARASTALAPAIAGAPVPPASIAPASVAPLAQAATRAPATLAFAEFYPLAAPVAADPVVSGSIAARDAHAAPGHPAARPGPRLAAARPACPGRRCPETPRGPDAALPGRADGLRGSVPPAGAEEPAGSGLPAAALPFTAVARALAPAAGAFGEAADLLRGGASSVRGAVALAVADCLR